MNSVQKYVGNSDHCFSGQTCPYERRKELSGVKPLKNQQLHKALIFSPDACIRKFLEGILVFQGYACTEAKPSEDISSDLSLHGHDVFFLDSQYWVDHEAEDSQEHVKHLVQTGLRVVVLADRTWSPDPIVMQSVGRCQILWKPLDYRQVAQIMGQI